MFDQTNGTNNFNYGMPNMAGYNYMGAQQPIPKFNNPLTAEEIKKLQKNSNQFSLTMTEDEYLRSVCNHRNAEGTADTLVYDSYTGEATCTICGYKFKPVDASTTMDSIKGDVANIIDILQTIKLMYIDLPAEAAKEYFQIIPMLEKIPQLFDFAAKNMTKHEAFNWQYNNRNMGAMNMFQNLQNMFASGFTSQQYAQQPYQQPQNPYAQPGVPVGYPAPVSNGFGYPGAQPNPAFAGYQQPVQPTYQPQTTGYQYQATPGQTPVTPTVTAPNAPVAGTKDDVTVAQSVNV